MDEKNATTKLCFQRQRRIDRAVKVDSSFVHLDFVVVVLMVYTDSECIHLEWEDNDVTSYSHECQNNANPIPYCISYPCVAGSRQCRIVKAKETQLYFNNSIVVFTHFSCFSRP